MELVDQRDDSAVYGRADGAAPLCGWVIVNHPDNALALYAPAGETLGELALIQVDQQKRCVCWIPPVHSDLCTLERVRQTAPVVASLIEGLQGQSETDFAALLGTVDAALWNMYPADSGGDETASVLAGRPLALVRVCLSLELEGPPHGGNGWKASLTPEPPTLLKEIFPVRLGDEGLSGDGLVGYFTAEEYGVFHSMTAPRMATPHIQQIGPPGAAEGRYIPLQFAQGGTGVTLMMDPRGSVHAYTGILPVKELRLPAKLTRHALMKLETAFHVGPVVTRIVPQRQREDSDAETSVQMPALDALGGEWSWWEPEPSPLPTGEGVWKGYTLEKTGNGAQINPIVPTLREGVLQMLYDTSVNTLLKKKEKDNG